MLSVYLDVVIVCCIVAQWQSTV